MRKTILLIFILSIVDLNAEGIRPISLNFHYNNSVLNSSENFKTLFTSSNDLYYSFVDPVLPKWSKGFSSTLFSFGITYMNILWSHEFGHWFRAREIGGSFNIHNMALPVPYTTLDLPEDVTPLETALVVSGGFEVNYLVSKEITKDFYFEGEMYADELALAFANRLFQPIYLSLIIPRDPSKVETWENPGGDTAFILLSVWEEKTGKYEVVTNNSVDSDFINLYWETAILTTLIHFFEPAFYQMLYANTLQAKDIVKAKWLIETDRIKWSFGPNFVMSTLGYDLFFNQYLQTQNVDILFYLKYGRPLKNQGVGLEVRNISLGKNWKLYFKTDIWNQHFWGWGGLGLIGVETPIKDHFGVTIDLGYKTNGIIQGYLIEESPILSIGLEYKF